MKVEWRNEGGLADDDYLSERSLGVTSRDRWNKEPSESDVRYGTLQTVIARKIETRLQES